MTLTEEQLRKEAVRRRLAGEPATEIAGSLGRSPRWVQKWVGRHEAGETAWAKGSKRGPKRAANRTPASVEAQVVAIRDALVANPWAQVGAEAIAWELRKLGVEPPPVRTIERIVSRSGATQRPRRSRRQSKGLPYPAPLAQRAGDVQEADLIGPRHLAGGVRFYVLNAIDLASHRCAIVICADNADERVASGLIALWQRLGLPVRLKLDNGGPFVGPRGLGLIARLCVHQGVIPHFIPQREPWRNGTVERFNDTFDKRFFRQEHFSSRSQLEQRSLAFETFHNGNHRYRASGGRTPDQSGSGSPRQPVPLAAVPLGWPERGRVEFVRFIRSDRKLRLLNRAISVPDALVYQYVTAVLDLSIPAGEDNLRVLNAGEIVTTASIKLGGR